MPEDGQDLRVRAQVQPHALGPAPIVVDGKRVCEGLSQCASVQALHVCDMDTDVYTASHALFVGGAEHREFGVPRLAGLCVWWWRVGRQGMRRGSWCCGQELIAARGRAPSTVAHTDAGKPTPLIARPCTGHSTTTNRHTHPGEPSLPHTFTSRVEYARTDLVEALDGLPRGGVEGGGLIKVQCAVLRLAEQLAGAVPCCMFMCMCLMVYWGS